MRRFWPLLLFVIIAFVATTAYQPTVITQTNTTKRIISLAPSITEILFSLDLADNIVGVTDYCDTPVQALSLPKVGGLINPNIEAIIALQPDLVVLLSHQDKLIKRFQQLNIPTLAVRNTSLNDIKHAITHIGQRTQRQSEAKKVVSIINQEIDRIVKIVSGLSRPTVMIALGHSLGSNHVKTAYIAGQHDFYNDLISLAGGQNVYQDRRLKVPSISSEGIIQLNPQVIIDIFPEANDHDANIANVLTQWNSLKYIDAVKNNRVHIIEQDYATLPGPRIFLLLEQLARLIHPELDWDNIAS